MQDEGMARREQRRPIWRPRSGLVLAIILGYITLGSYRGIAPEDFRTDASLSVSLVVSNASRSAECGATATGFTQSSSGGRHRSQPIDEVGVSAPSRAAASVWLVAYQGGVRWAAKAT